MEILKDAPAKKPKKTAKNSKTKAQSRKRAAPKPKTAAKKTRSKNTTAKPANSRGTIKKQKVNENELALLGNEESNPETLEICKAKIREAAVLQYKIEQFEEQVKEMKREHQALVGVELPELCQELRLTSFECDDGVKLKITDFVSGSLPKDEAKRKEALTYLRKLKGGALIKTAVNARFGRGDSPLANKVARELKKMGVEFEKKQDVHHASLSKYARELMESGQAPDLEKLGLYSGTHAKITLPI